MGTQILADQKLGLVFLLTLFPIYRFVTWILIFNELEFATQAERVKAYHEQYFFGNSADERLFTLITLAIIGIVLFLLISMNKVNIVVKVILGAIISFLALLNGWSLL